MSYITEVSIAAMYLMAGADRARGAGWYTGSLDSVGGHIGLAAELAPYAEKIELFLMKHTNQDTDWPGVFHYEVTEELGKWFVEHLEEKNLRTKFNLELERRFKAFINR